MFSICVSIFLAIKLLAYGGTYFCPMAEPISCFHHSPLNSKILNSWRISRSLVIKDGGTFLCGFSFSPSKMLCAPSSCGVFVKSAVASIVARSAFSGSFPSLFIASISLRKCGVSSRNEGIFSQVFDMVLNE